MKKIIVAIILLSMSVTVFGQQVGVKSNILYGMTLTPNAGVELSVGRHSSVQLNYGLHPWRNGEKMLRHWVLNPSYRYWFCEPFMGSHVDIEGYGGQYRAGGYELPFGLFKDFSKNRYVGWYVGGGVSYGYSYPLSRHWNLEGVFGVGYLYSPYTAYECERCGAVTGRGRRHYVGPTKVALNLVFVF